MRLFVALELSKNARETVSALQEKIKKVLNCELKWVLPENLHITLKFLGEINPALLPEINSKMAFALNKKRKFKVVLQGLGLFPGMKRPRVLWAGISEGSNSIVDLIYAIEKSLNSIDIAKDSKKKFPHLTLGRFKNTFDYQSLKALIDNYHDCYFTDFTACKIVLYQSILRPNGPCYKPLNFFNLQ